MHNTYEDIFLNYTLKYWLVSVSDTLRYTNKIALFCIFTLHFYLCFPFTVLQLFFHCVFLVGWVVVVVGFGCCCFFALRDMVS